MKYEKLRKIEKKLDRLIRAFDEECGDTPDIAVRETHTHLATADMWMLCHIISMEKAAARYRGENDDKLQTA